MKERLDRTRELPTARLPSPRSAGFQPGVAPIPQRRPDPTLPIEPSGQVRRPRPSLRVRLRRLRKGGGWSVAGLVALLICWALWAADSGVAQLASTGIVLLLTLGVAVGLFGVARLTGGYLLERVMKRTRRGAVLSHLAIGGFLTAAGVSLLGQVDWVVAALSQLRGIG